MEIRGGALILTSFFAEIIHDTKLQSGRKSANRLIFLGFREIKVVRLKL